MSRYAVPADLSDFGVQNQATQGMSQTTLQRLLDAASDFADAFLTHFKLPLVSWGLSLTEAVCKIGAFNALVSRGFNPDDGLDVLAKSRHDQALEFLQRMADEKITPASFVDQSPWGTGDSGPPLAVQTRFEYGRTTQASIGGFPSSTQPGGANTGLIVGPATLRGW